MEPVIITEESELSMDTMCDIQESLSEPLPSNLSNVCFKDKRILLEQINSLSSTEHEEIYRIVTDGCINISKNKNGVFFNLTSIPDDILSRIDTFVSYCLSNKEQLDEYDKKLNECKLSNKYGKIVNMNINLETFVDSAKEEPKDCTWKTKVDCKSMQKITFLLERMHEDRDKLHVKKLNSKFINAKKRYSKKCSSEKKFDCENGIELVSEAYLL
jgi:hypothetical protein